jgi:ubiquitin carboxyl-terminal hydrolase L3
MRASTFNMEPANPSPQRTYRKHFIPLESNPDVFTELVHKLGIAQSLSFQDVLSLDDPELLAFIPRPAYGLVLVFPTTEPYEKRCAQVEASLGEYQGSGPEEPVIFWKQTINNACGLYALLHAITNGDARAHLGKLDPLLLGGSPPTCRIPADIG